MARVDINIPLPSTLTAEKDITWDETTDGYQWWVIVKFGSVEVGRILYSTQAQSEPTQEEMDQTVAARLKGLFQ